jgi:hypothetical protein
LNGDNVLKEVYCRTHQPWQGAGTFGGDAVEIKTALAAQKKASDKVCKLTRDIVKKQVRSIVLQRADNYVSNNMFSYRMQHLLHGD